MKSESGDNHAFVVQDMYSKLKCLYPVPKKDAEHTVEGIRMFAGDRMVRRLYSDNSGEIGKALKQLKIMPHN